MTKVLSKNYIMPKLGVKMQTLAAIIAIVCSVILPQLVHTFGILTGTGSSLGEMLLPMHLPVLMVGFLAGPYAGVVAGLMSPIISFYFTAMPGVVMLPFMIIELGCYGLVSGLIRNTKINIIFKVFTAQLVGRIVKALAILVMFFFFGGSVAPIVILSSICAGILGIVIQLVLIPVIMNFFAVEDK